MLTRIRDHLAASAVTPLQLEIARLHRERGDLLKRHGAVSGERDALKADLALREAICPGCGPVSRCDEDRCCCFCGRDLIVVADKMSAELLVDAFAERDTLQARLDALTPAPVKPLSVERRRAVLTGVSELMGMVSDSVGYSPTAEAIAEYIDTDTPECLCTVSVSSIMRFVSRLAAEGYLVSDGKKPARYHLTDAGRADLAVAA